MVWGEVWIPDWPAKGILPEEVERLDWLERDDMVDVVARGWVFYISMDDDGQRVLLLSLLVEGTWLRRVGNGGGAELEFNWGV